MQAMAEWSWDRFRDDRSTSLIFYVQSTAIEAILYISVRNGSNFPPGNWLHVQVSKILIHYFSSDTFHRWRFGENEVEWAGKAETIGKPTEARNRPATASKAMMASPVLHCRLNLRGLPAPTRGVGAYGRGVGTDLNTLAAWLAKVVPIKLLSHVASVHPPGLSDWHAQWVVGQILSRPQGVTDDGISSDTGTNREKQKQISM